MHKTGTTALQSLLTAQRDELTLHGVAYPGRLSAHHRAACSLRQLPVGPAGASPPPETVWQDLARVVRATPHRVVISSEFLSGANPTEIGRLVDDLGIERIHIVIGVRNLGAMALSSWQQALKAGSTTQLDDWMGEHVQAGFDPSRGSFWDRQNPAATINRFTDAVGMTRVTVVVIDESDRKLLPDAFERLLDLPFGLLTGTAPTMTNRGMSAAEAELVRRVNAALRDELSWPQYVSMIRYGLIRRLVEERTPGPDEPKPRLPDWVWRQSAADGQRIAHQISDSGVQIVGDLASLTRHPQSDAPTAAAGSAKDIAIQAAVQAVVGTAAGARQRRTAKPPPDPPQFRVEGLRSRELMAILASRARVAARRRLRPLRDATDATSEPSDGKPA